jgi:putative nucleotidyltransferase with HDIG domain
MKQFFRGLFATITKEDEKFISEYLTRQEKELFFRLRVSEQYHSLKVAYGCSKHMPYNKVLVRAALLHDIGKIDTNLHLLNKVFVVLVAKFEIESKLLPTFIQKAIVFKEVHPERGYNRLAEIKVEEDVLQLVKNHHKGQSISEEMKVLQYYDNLY